MDTVRKTARGETVMPYWIFKQLQFEAVMKAVGKPYPRKKRKGKKR
jgi:hypothetical protein